jgi:hypothetical protein
MKTDADTVIDRIGVLIPDVKVIRMHKTHPADDDGLWWFRLPGTDKDIQIESSSFNLPFLVEHSDMMDSSEAITTTTIEETVKAISDYLNHLKQEAEQDAPSNGG